MDQEESKKREILIYLLEQIKRSGDRKKRLDRRLEQIREWVQAPIRGVSYDPMPKTPSSSGWGMAASICFKMCEIEEAIDAQKAEIEKAVVRVMDLLEYIPAHTQEREICEMIYIDCMSVPSVAESIPMSKSQVYRYRNQGLDIILQNSRVQQIIEEHEAEYKVYAGNLKN